MIVKARNSIEMGLSGRAIYTFKTTFPDPHQWPTVPYGALRVIKGSGII